jgi:hypothetical protein
MRIAMGDLTSIWPLGLPSFASGLSTMPVYSGGLTGLGVCDPATSIDTVTGLYCTPSSSPVVAVGPCPEGEVMIAGSCEENPSAGTMLEPGTTSPITQAQMNAITAGLFPAPGVQSTAGGATPTTSGISSGMLLAIAAGFGLLIAMMGRR